MLKSKTPSLLQTQLADVKQARSLPACRSRPTKSSCQDRCMSVPCHPMDEVLSAMADEPNPRIPAVSRKNNGFSRSDIVAAFHSSFEIIGGVNRLALWAHANPDKFYPLYAKLLPSTTQILGDGGALEIIHRIAPTKLDQHDVITAEEVDQMWQQSNSNTPQGDTSPHSTPEMIDG